MRRRALIVPAVLALGLGLAACSSGGSGGDTETSAEASSEATEAATEASESEADSGAFPVTLSNTFGDTTIQEQPTTLAAVAWSNGTTALALGVMPAGIAASTYGVEDDSQMLPWTKEAIEELGGEAPVLFDETDGINFEQISALAPDVILASYSGLTQEDYDTLTQIAPTVSYPEAAWGTTWREAIELESTAIGLADEGTDLIASLEQQIDDAVAARPALADKNIAMAYVDPTNMSTISFYTTLDNRVAYLSDFGFATPASITALGEESFFAEVSAENADTLSDIDIIVTYGDDTLLATLQADPLLGQIPAIARGSVAVIGDGTALSAAATPDALSIPWALDDYLDAINTAAEKVS